MTTIPTPTTEDKSIDVKASVVIDDYPSRTLTFYIDPNDLLAAVNVDACEWEYDDVNAEWSEGDAGIFVHFRPDVDDEDLWEDELAEAEQ